MTKKIITISSFLLIITFILSGCVTVKTSNTKKDTSTINAGVFKSINKGTSWQQKVLIPSTSGKPGNIANLDGASIAIDPSDNKAVYFGSVGEGLFYSYDAGDSWRPVSGLGKGTVRAVAVDPNNKCVIYAAIGNKVSKTSDCGRSWTQVYIDNESAVTIDAFIVDPYNSSIVYLGLSRGDILRSTDGGANWSAPLYRAKDKIKQIAIDPNDTKMMFIATNKKGVFRTSDGGTKWEDINANIKKLKVGTMTNKLILIKGEKGLLFLATENGIIKSTDYGTNWEKLPIIPPEAKAQINDMAVNPNNIKEIYYVTNTIFYKSVDGGANWATIKLPTARMGWIMAIDNKEPNNIYIGVMAPKK